MTLIALAPIDDSFIGFWDEWSRMRDIKELAMAGMPSLGGPPRWMACVGTLAFDTSNPLNSVGTAPAARAAPRPSPSANVRTEGAIERCSGDCGSASRCNRASGFMRDTIKVSRSRTTPANHVSHRTFVFD